MAHHPALIAALRPRLGRATVNGWIEDSNDLAVNFHGVGNPDRILGQHTRQRRGHCGLARSRRAIKKDRGAGVERGSELAQRLLVDHQVREGAVHIGWAHDRVAHTLLPCLVHVALQRYGRDPGILALRQHFHRTVSALGGDGDPRNVGGHSRNLAVMLRAQAEEQFIRHFKTQSSLLRDLDDRKGTGQVKNLERQIFENRLSYIEIRNRLGLQSGS